MGDVDQVAVVVPLQERDLVRVEQRHQLVADVRVRLGHLQVDHLLVSPRRRQVVAAAQDPVRMCARHVGVGADHLGFDPEAELHAEPADVVDQGSEAVRPHRFVDGPVAERAGVVAAAVKPAVVEHEPFDADARRHVGQAAEPVEVVVEVDGLPGVEHDRASPSRMPRPSPQPPMQPGAGAVEPGVGPGRAQPRRLVRLPRREHDLVGSEQLASAED
jgi:hypothetical protein